MLVVSRRALMPEVVGFIQLACTLTLGIPGGWAVHQMGVVMGWSGFCRPPVARIILEGTASSGGLPARLLDR
jgi:hypothetical protein